MSVCVALLFDVILGRTLLDWRPITIVYRDGVWILLMKPTFMWINILNCVPFVPV